MKNGRKITETVPVEEELLEQATEDVSTYLWALKSWPNPPGEYGLDYLLLLTLCSRNRGRSALEMLRGDIPIKDRDYRQKLISLRDTAELLLDDLVTQSSDRIELLINQAFQPRLNRLETALEKIRCMYQDGTLVGDPDAVGEELGNAAQDFFMEFRDLSLAGDELGENPLMEKIDSTVFRENLVRIEKRFQRNFGYFSTIRHLFPSIRAREYNLDRWWLNRIPTRADITEEILSEEVLNVFVETYRSQNIPSDEDCPMSDAAIGYAFGELEAGEHGKFKAHLGACPVCLNLVLDLKAAGQDAVDGAEKPAGVPPVLKGAIGGKVVGIGGYERKEDARVVFNEYRKAADSSGMGLKETSFHEIMEENDFSLFIVQLRDLVLLRFVSDNVEPEKTAIGENVVELEEKAAGVLETRLGTVDEMPESTQIVVVVEGRQIGLMVQFEFPGPA